jgi:hypothetical protein
MDEAQSKPTLQEYVKQCLTEAAEARKLREIPLQEESDAFQKDILPAWRARAREATLETLPAFLQELMTKYGHDYGTICHALATGAVATVWAMNREEQGGVTGFQAGAIMWEFIRNWNLTDNKVGMRLLDFDNLLYPQYGHHFCSIPAHVWEKVQEEARHLLTTASGRAASASVQEHWQSIADGLVPFGLSIESKD